MTSAIPITEPISVDVTLRDAARVHIRPVTPGDEPAVRAFLEGVSSDSLAFRFFGAPSISWATRWAVDMDGCDRYGLIATSGPDGRVVAHGAYVRTGEDSAEAAFLVADRWQCQGIATAMLQLLADAAARHGIARLTAEVLPYNHRMLAVLEESGFPIERRPDRGSVHVELPTSRGVRSSALQA